ncbi:MFS polyamine transporter [Multifurca ochricompacta]|uniref:MFS polyamine transporter n=1 Tax=Multifurca ochricompacta TaxID=376703 RepID=A0AAD4LZ65_9AGAM|nr:MFS polyamine transporter [Multifurca ochricompacta]
MGYTDHSVEHSPTATALDYTTSLEAEVERTEHHTEYGDDSPEKSFKGSRPKKGLAGPASSIGHSDSIIVTWDGPDDPENPKNWSFGYKWFITIICSLLTLNVTYASSAPSTASFAISRHFHSSTEESYLVTSMFLLGYVFGPMFWGPGSELVGRRPAMIFSLAIYTILHLGQALAQDMKTVIITRFFAGFFACSPLTNSGGVIADIWDPVNRGVATSVFSTTVFLGPVLGPVISGYIVVSHLGWRWVFWVMMIFAGFCTALGAVFIPETYAPARRLRALDPEKNKNLYAEGEKIDWAPRAFLDRTILRPIRMLFVEPILLLITVYISLVYGVIYAMFEAFPVIFVRIHHFTIQHDGLIFIGVGIGSAMATLANIWLLRPYPRLLKEWRGYPPPEARLPSAMIGGPLLAISIFLLGWTGNYESVPWYVPALSTIPLGASIALVFMSCLSYLVDTYLMYSASAFAANTMMRSIVGAAFPLFTVQMYEGMGVNWASTLIGGVALLLAPMPFFFYKYGPRIRANSQFAPCMDLKIAKEIEAERKAAEGKLQV